jgi:hypothetical protein
MFPAVYEKKNGTLSVRYRNKLSSTIIGIALVLAGSFLLPAGLLLLASSNWFNKLPWMILGLGCITEAGGLLLILSNRLRPAGFEVNRTFLRIIEKKGPSLSLPRSYFNECGIRSPGQSRNGPFYVFLRGPAGLDFDLSSYRSKKKAIADLQLLSSVSEIPLPEEPASPEGRLRRAYALPELKMHIHHVPELKAVIQRLRAEGSIVLSSDGCTLRLKDRAARKHSILALPFLLFLVSIAMTALAEGIPFGTAAILFSVLILLAGWIIVSAIRSVFFDEGLSIVSGRFMKRRFSVFRKETTGYSSSRLTNPETSQNTDQNCIPILAYSSQVGVPAIGYFGDDYRALLESITLQPWKLMQLAFRRYFAFRHRLYGFTLSESVAIYSVIREVFSDERCNHCDLRK